MASKYQKHRPINLANQMILLKKTYPEAKCWISKNILYWEGTIFPTPISDSFNLEIIYQLKKKPQVWLSGRLISQNIKRFDTPHKYDIDMKLKKIKLCLYRYNEFDSHELIANTLIPWAIEWAYYYENWLITGKWLGGGEHPKIR